MQHRAKLEGLRPQPVEEGFGLRYPRTPPHPDRRRIPKRFHQVYISGEEHYKGVCKNPKSLLNCSARQSCLMYLADWEHFFWDGPAIEALIQEYYPWALEMYHNYDMEVKRADLGRYLILHRYGGLYLDIDCQCFRDPIDSFTDFDLVVQGSGLEGVNQGMLAAAPGLPLWQDLMKILEDRAVPTGDAWRDGPIFMTGPRAMSEIFMQHLNVEVKNFWRLGYDGYVGHYEDYVIKVFPLGTWFMPCWISDLECRARFERGEAPEVTQDLSQLVGYHQFASIWG